MKVINRLLPPLVFTPFLLVGVALAFGDSTIAIAGVLIIAAIVGTWTAYALFPPARPGEFPAWKRYL
jgi:hypothetical protein